jgi:hypothetical protein
LDKAQEIEDASLESKMITNYERKPRQSELNHSRSVSNSRSMDSQSLNAASIFSNAAKSSILKATAERAAMLQKKAFKLQLAVIFSTLIAIAFVITNFAVTLNLLRSNSRNLEYLTLYVQTMSFVEDIILI